MRYFWVFVEGRTDGNFSLKALTNAGRMDIAARVVNSAFWLSGDIRRDVILYITFTGPPDPPKTVKFVGAEMKRVYPDERNICSILRRGLGLNSENWYEFHPGVYVSRKVEEIREEVGLPVALMSESGTLFEPGEYIYLIGGKEDVPEEYLSKIKVDKTFSLGKKSYLASHVVTIINYILDRGEEGGSLR